MFGRMSRLHLTAAIPAGVLIAACGGGGETEGAQSPTGPPADETPTEPGAAGGYPIPGKPAALVINDDGSAAFEFEEFDATLTIPEGALPDGVLLDDITAETIDLKEGSAVVAHFRFGPDGLVLEDPLLLEFTLSLAPSGLLAGLLLGQDGQPESILNVADADGGEGASVERVSDGLVRVSVEVAHFSELFFLTSEQDGGLTLKVEQNVLAASYEVRSGGVAQLSIELVNEQYSLYYEIPHEERDGRMVVLQITAEGTVDPGATANGHWEFDGPLALLAEQPDDASGGVSPFDDGLALFEAPFTCQGPGEFAIRLRFVNVNMEVTTRESILAVALDGSPLDEAIVHPSVELVWWRANGDDPFWLSECVESAGPALPETTISFPLRRASAFSATTYEDIELVDAPEGLRDIRAGWYRAGGVLVVVFDGLDTDVTGAACPGASLFDSGFSFWTHSPTAPGACDADTTIALPGPEGGVRVCNGVVSFITDIPEDAEGFINATVNLLPADGQWYGVTFNVSYDREVPEIDASVLSCD